jgi:4-amino-4-deoxy-L-arabinose transferase-like glycosyltransferase
MQKLLHILKAKDFFAYALLAVGFVGRLFYIFIFTTPEKYLWSDPGGYDLRALQMAKDQYVMFSTYFPPFFHMVLSLLYRPLAWLNLVDWRIKIDIVIFALFYIFSFWCIYQIVKKLFSRNIALIVLIALIAWYPFIYLNYLVMSENLFFLLFFFGLYLIVTKPLKPFMGLFIGLLWGSAFLTRPIFAFALPLFFIWCLCYKTNWKFLAIFTITVCLIVGSMMLFNFFYTHGEEKSISSNSGVGFAMLMCDAKSLQLDKDGYYFWFGPPSNIDYPDSKKLFTNVPFTNQPYYFQMGLNCLSKNPRPFYENFASMAKLFDSKLFPSLDNVAHFELFRQIFKTLVECLTFFSILTVIAIIFDWLPVRKETEKFLILFILVILSLLPVVFLFNFGEERYIIPYTPLLIILSIPLLWKQFLS